MNTIMKFWSQHYPADGGALEEDSGVRRFVNRYVVAGLMNVFPKTVTKLLSLSRGEFARLMMKEKVGGSFQSLRAMYEYEDPSKRGDLINRLLMQSPGVKAARNRRKIAQRLLQRSLEKQPADKPVLLLAMGGGDGRLEAEVIARVPRQDIYYCVVDKDEHAIDENQKTLEEHGLVGRGGVFLANIAKKAELLTVLDNAQDRYGVRFDGANIAVCHGIAEYMDIGLSTNDALHQMLTAIHGCLRPEGNLIISQTDYHDRVRWVERGLGWHMRMRGIDELADEVEKAGWHIVVCEHEPMRLISMCLAVKSESPSRRIDSPSQTRPSVRRKRTPANTRTAVAGS